MRVHAGFNPRARVGRDPGETEKDRSRRVSIHAPAWGATDKRPISGVSPTVSIHAPAWGATSCHYQTHQQMLGFNPRARVGRDRLT